MESAAEQQAPSRMNILLSGIGMARYQGAAYMDNLNDEEMFRLGQSLAAYSLFKEIQPNTAITPKIEEVKESTPEELLTIHRAYWEVEQMIKTAYPEEEIKAFIQSSNIPQEEKGN